jgi:hypothetical protein
MVATNTKREDKRQKRQVHHTGGRSMSLLCRLSNRQNLHPLIHIRRPSSPSPQPRPARQIYALVSAISSHSGQRPILRYRYNGSERASLSADYVQTPCVGTLRIPSLKLDDFTISSKRDGGSHAASLQATGEVSRTARLA